jgi:hypothetical protein
MQRKKSMPAKESRKTPSAKKSTKKENNGGLTLDDAIVALQKSFSRVSAKSAEVPFENARAMVTGTVNFDMTLKVQPEKDYLNLDANGAIDLRLSGTIDTDIRVEEDGQTP